MIVVTIQRENFSVPYATPTPSRPSPEPQGKESTSATMEAIDGVILNPPPHQYPQKFPHR
jgi:hypothetical protein